MARSTLGYAIAMVKGVFDCHSCYEMDKTHISMFKILKPGCQFWANTAFEGLNSINLGYLNFTARLT